MKYAYENMSETQFEELCIFICQQLLGISVQGFSKGKDGGRDAKFVGTAELHPSKAEPWVGTTIIQAKHTNNINRSFSEKDFYSKDSNATVLGEEIERIRKLRADEMLDNYILFSNRKLSGNGEAEIRKALSVQCSLPESSIYLCGVEQIEILLRTYPDIAERARVDPIDCPLIVSPDNLAEVVQAIAANKDALDTIIDDPPTDRTGYKEKNVSNNMSTGYEKALRRRYLKDTSEIRNFLALPENRKILRCYESVADEFELKIISKRKDFQSFDAVMEYLVDILFGRDPILRQQGHKRITRAVLYYMYWNCDIGGVEDVEAN